MIDGAPTAQRSALFAVGDVGVFGRARSQRRAKPRLQPATHHLVSQQYGYTKLNVIN
jgi:hypothetical protein